MKYEPKAKHLDELDAIGFALAKSAALLPEFSICTRHWSLLHAASMNEFCSESEVETLQSAMRMLFTRRPLVQSTSPKEDKDQARMLKTPEQIQEAWRLIFKLRRLQEPDDRRTIEDPERRANMWITWQ